MKNINLFETAENFFGKNTVLNEFELQSFYFKTRMIERAF